MGHIIIFPIYTASLYATLKPCS